MRMSIYPYHKASKSARELSRALRIKRIKQQNSKFIGRMTKMVINWGSSDLPEQVKRCRILNKPEKVGIASNKLRTFQKLAENSEINIPEFTTSIETAKSWTEDGTKCVIRSVLNGHSGQGISITDNAEEITHAPLYTKYINKKQDYRVHIVNGQVIDLQRKARSREVADEDVNWQVRNHGNGFIFMREGVELPQHAKEMCLKACQTIGLDFCAIDLIWNESEDKYYIIEVNTACGLSGTTLEKYTEAFNRVRFGR